MEQESKRPNIIAQIIGLPIIGLVSLAYGVLVVTLGVAVFGVFLLFVYGLVVIVFRSAFGIDLPNPVDWLPPEWLRKIDVWFS